MPRCADCAYLSIYHFETGIFREADEDQRSRGEFNEHGCFDLPRCFVRAYRLQDEAPSRRFEEIKQVVTKDRPCTRFKEWEPGVSPKESLERERAMEERRFQEERLERDRKFQAEQRENERKFHQEQRGEERRLQHELRAEERRLKKRETWGNRLWGLALLGIGALISQLISWWVQRPMK